MKAETYIVVSGETGRTDKIKEMLQRDELEADPDDEQYRTDAASDRRQWLILRPAACCFGRPSPADAVRKQRGYGSDP